MNTTAIRSPTLSLVKADILLPPLESKEMLTCGIPYSSNEDVASTMCSPVKIVRFSSNTLPTGDLSYSYNLERGGTRPLSAADKSPFESATLNSKVAVAPKISFALAVSCTPGN